MLNIWKIFKINKFKKEIYEDKSEEKINEMNNNINLLYSCFEKN